MLTSVTAFLEFCETCGHPRRGCDCLFDILDPSAFVHKTINNAHLVLSPDERDELHAEGLALLQKLAVDYRPHIPGHGQEGRFSGYAAMFLARKLGDAWHRMHPEHLLVTQLDGKRKWEYRDRAVSLEAIVADEPDRADLLADRRGQRGDLKNRLHAALYERWCREVRVIVEVGELLSEGATPADVATMLGLTPTQVREAMNTIAPVISRLQSEEI
jgi:hypothetical protein